MDRPKNDFFGTERRLLGGTKAVAQFTESEVVCPLGHLYSSCDKAGNCGTQRPSKVVSALAWKAAPKNMYEPRSYNYLEVV